MWWKLASWRLISCVRVSLTYVLYRNNLDNESATHGSQLENLVYQKRACIKKKTFKTFSVYSESCVAWFCEKFTKCGQGKKGLITRLPMTLSSWKFWIRRRGLCFQWLFIISFHCFVTFVIVYLICDIVNVHPLWYNICEEKHIDSRVLRSWIPVQMNFCFLYTFVKLC